MTTMHEAPRQRRFGFKRWIILGLFVLGGVLAFGVGGIFKPVAPAVVIPGEPVWPTLPHSPNFTLTNTMLATLVADLILILIALTVRGGRLVPSGFYNVFEAIVEFLWNASESAAGR